MSKKILLVGEHPFTTTGNAGMLNAICEQIDTNLYSIICFCAETAQLKISKNDENFPFQIISANSDNDPFGKQKLINIIRNCDLDAVLFIGIDIWRYIEVFADLKRLREEKGFLWGAIFPYDLGYIRDDWKKWIEAFDFPCVYSEFGYKLLKDNNVKNIRYFRPPLHKADMFKKLSDTERKSCRRVLLPGVTDDTIVFGYIGANQIRKDPQKLLKAFSTFQKTTKEKTILYMHTDVNSGIFNLKQYCFDCGLTGGQVRVSATGGGYEREEIVKFYNAIDCFVLCSMQEGLSWTPIEAMLCGVPVILSNTTAHKDLISLNEDKVAVSVPCEQEAYIKLYGYYGATWVDAKACRSEDITDALAVMMNKEVREHCSEMSLKKGNDWIDNVSDINNLFKSVFQETIKVKKQKIDAVLFAQHSAAGDVLMTTQCLKGIKEKHPEKKLVYMTQTKFQGLLENNPYIDEVIDWDFELLKSYAIVYNPHGEKILPGGWNNLDVKLYSMYPYFCKVEADKPFIYLKEPSNDILSLLPDNYIVVNTAGGSEYRRYEHTDVVFNKFNIPIVQIGGESDPVVSKAINLNGQLDYCESAWVLSKAKACLVIDSFCSHLAGALDIPTVCLYGPAPARVVGPRFDNPDKIINMEPNMLEVCAVLSHCWGTPPNGKRTCQSPCINTINPIKVRKNLLSLIEGKE